MRHFTRISFFCCIILAFPLIAKAQKEIVVSCAPETPPVIDGDPSEWKDDWLEDSKKHFLYNVCNDQNNLYLRLKITDVYIQQKVAVFGLTVLLSPEGKKNGEVGIVYPVERDLTELGQDNSKKAPTSRAEWIKLKNDLVADCEALELIGLAKEHISSSRTGLMNGIEVIIRGDSIGDYVYEAKIPFKSLKIKKAAVKNLGITLRTGKLKQAPKANQPTQLPGAGGMSPGTYMRYGRPTQQQMTSYRATPYNEMMVSTFMFTSVKLQ